VRHTPHRLLGGVTSATHTSPFSLIGGGTSAKHITPLVFQAACTSIELRHYSAAAAVCAVFPGGEMARVNRTENPMMTFDDLSPESINTTTYLVESPRHHLQITLT